MFGLEPGTSFSTPASSTGGDWKVGFLDEDAVRLDMASIVKFQQGLHKNAAQRVEKNRDTQRRVACEGQLPNFVVGDHVLAARVRHSETMSKLVSTLGGLRRIVALEKRHVYGVQSMVTGEVLGVHVACLDFIQTSSQRYLQTLGRFL